MSLVDERLDLIVYSCEPCGREVGSPMPANMRCIECSRPMPPSRVRPAPDHPWSPWRERPQPPRAQPALFGESG